MRKTRTGDSAIILTLSIATGLLFFVSLLLHELSHSLFARSRGLPVREITLFALGGVSQIEKNPSSAKTEFWMAFVGPLSSACIGLICLGLRTYSRSSFRAGIRHALLAWLYKLGSGRFQHGSRLSSRRGPRPSRLDLVEDW